MLAEAQRLRAQGLDILIGVAETHGRKETAAMLEGLSTLPQRRLSHRGRYVKEFDLDGALARRPALIWSMSWRTATRPDRVILNAGRTSKSCWKPASMCLPPLTFSTSRA